MRRLIALLALCLVLAGLPAAADAQEGPAEGTIKGQVVNGTEGGGSVAGVEITLIAYVNNTMSETRTTVADSEGKFQFDGIDLEPTYLVSAKYMGVAYYYPVEFEPGATEAYVEAGVCDVTTDDRAIRIGMAHTVINVEEDSLYVTEVYWLVNDGDTTYTGTENVLVFTLPEGAFGFEAPSELVMEFRLLEGNRVTYLVPFPPGERQLVYAYSLAKPEAGEFTIPLKVDYPTDSLEIMVGGGDTEVAVSQLAPADPVVTGEGERFIHFQGKDLPRDMIINLHLANLSGGGISPWQIGGVVIGIMIVAGAAFYLVRRKRKARASE
jgi:hypothetical protein